MNTIQRLVSQRRSIGLMVRQDLKSYYGKYQLGLLWTMAEPFMQALFMWIVFALIFGSTKGISQQPFIVYVVTGLLPLGWLTTSVGGGPKIFRNYGQILATSRMPPVVWPMRPVLTGLSDMILALPVVVIFAVTFFLLTGEPTLSWGIVLVPVGIAFQVVLCLGMAMIGASLAVHFQDVERMTFLVNRFFFWMSPVLWSQRNFPEWLTPWLYLNPFHGILDCYRATFWPDVLTHWTNYAISATVIFVIFGIGLTMMRSRVSEMRRFV